MIEKGEKKKENSRTTTVGPVSVWAVWVGWAEPSRNHEAGSALPWLGFNFEVSMLIMVYIFWSRERRRPPLLDLFCFEERFITGRNHYRSYWSCSISASHLKQDSGGAEMHADPTRRVFSYPLDNIMCQE